jgi:hypothetical protein
MPHRLRSSTRHIDQHKGIDDEQKIQREKISHQQSYHISEDSAGAKVQPARGH